MCPQVRWRGQRAESPPAAFVLLFVGRAASKLTTRVLDSIKSAAEKSHDLCKLTDWHLGWLGTLTGTNPEGNHTFVRLDSSAHRFSGRKQLLLGSLGDAIINVAFQCFNVIPIFLNSKNLGT